ncbi:hypothetical protein O181_002812 [Austropuccinia psidii MF-1]|uniref:Reverse transcriptase domain-containing protein n=1 Tax=Austropuccinia psidii MF-1 TaxID=1389203 RepID=A0A9Q3BDH9_9BASI|nr:hypothetical protein [Austropuccinia psidii MF-1]
MQFGLTNTPAYFQKVFNDIFYNFPDIEAVAYLDDIMVFFKSEEVHVTHVSTVLSRLRAKNLLAKASKFLFHVSSAEYLGYAVSSEGLRIDQEKVKQILNWPPPGNLKPLQSFLVLATFYRHFIKYYSKKINSLTSFLKEDSCYLLNEEALKKFNQLKGSFTIAPILLYPPFCKLLPAEHNYEINEKELLGIVWALKRWGAVLLSVYSSFEILTDHSSLQYCMSSNILTFCQACWAEFRSEFLFSITYFPECLATLPDALSCWGDICPERREDFISKNPMNYQNRIKQDEIKASKFFAVKVDSFSNLVDSIQKPLWQDYKYRSILQDLGKDKSVQAYYLDSSSSLLLFKEQVVIPNDPTIQLSILQKGNDSTLAGHPGQEKTLKTFK